jgi:hypothetical protein
LHGRPRPPRPKPEPAWVQEAAIEWRAERDRRERSRYRRAA